MQAIQKYEQTYKEDETLLTSDIIGNVVGKEWVLNNVSQLN